MNPIVRLAATLVLAGCSAVHRASLGTPAAPLVPEARALAFFARAAADGVDARVELGVDLGELAPIESGDVLGYDLYVATPGLEVAGFEIALDDGTLLVPPRAPARAAWTRQTVALGAHRGSRVASVRLVALGSAANDGAIFVVDDVELVRATGERDEIFRDVLPRAAARIDDPNGRAACVSVGVSSHYPAAWVPAAEKTIVEPWAILDIGRAQGQDDSRAPSGGPDSTVYLDTGVPFRLATDAEHRGVALRGQRIALSPLDGGRYYELHLALDAEPGTSTTWTILGRSGESRPLSIDVPARATDATSGAAARSFVVLSLPIAAAFAIDGFRAPDDPRVRLLAATVRWHKEAPAEPRFRRAWIEREEPTEAVRRWRRDLEHGAHLARIADEDVHERRLFDLLLAEDRSGFRALLEERLAHFAELGAAPDGERITLVPSFDLASARADEVERVLALLESRADWSCSVTSAGACAALAAREPRLFARLRDLARAGRVELAGARWTTGRAPLLDEPTLVRDLALGVRWARENGFRTLLGDLGGSAGDAASARALPQLWRSAGLIAVLDARGRVARSRVFRAASDDGTKIAAIALPSVPRDVTTADALARALWIARDRAGSGEIAIALPLDGSARDARRLAAVDELAVTDLAPDVRIATLTQFIRDLAARPDAYFPTVEAICEPGAERSDVRGADAVERRERIALERAVSAELSVAERFGALAGADGLTWSRDEARDLGRRFLEASEPDRDPTASAAAVRALLARAAALVREELAVLARSVRTEGPGDAIVVFNPLPWDRAEQLEVESGAAGVLDADLRMLAVQRRGSGALRFRAEVPALGYAVFHLVSAGVTPAAAHSESDPSTCGSTPAEPAAATLRAARERGQPLRVVRASVHEGARPARHSFLRLARIESDGSAPEGEAARIDLVAFEPAADGKGWLLRVHETRGTTCTARLSLDRSLFAARRTSLVEDPFESLPIAGGRSVEIALGAWGFETIRVDVRP